MELKTLFMIKTVAITLRNALSRDPSTLSSETDSHCTRYVKRSSMKSITKYEERCSNLMELKWLPCKLAIILCMRFLYAPGSVYIRTGCVSWRWIRRASYYFQSQSSFSSSLSHGSVDKLTYEFPNFVHECRTATWTPSPTPTAAPWPRRSDRWATPPPDTLFSIATSAAQVPSTWDVHGDPSPASFTSGLSSKISSSPKDGSTGAKRADRSKNSKPQTLTF